MHFPFCFSRLRDGLLASLAAMALCHCSIPTIVDIGVGPFQYTVNASNVMLPGELRDDSTMTVRSIPCMDDTQCPSLGDTGPAIHCVMSACDPDPFTFALSTDVIDLDMNPNIQRYGDHITRIEVRSATYTATAQGLQNPVGPTELYWGPESATSIDSSDVQHAGTIPLLDLNGDGTAQGDVELDPSGSAALSDFLLNTSHKLRLFARPSVDLAPGGPLPAGTVILQVQMNVHVEGQLVR